MDIKKIFKNKSILEVGCNIGVITKQLLELNPRKIIAVDSDKNHLKKFTIKKPNVKYIHLDIIKHTAKINKKFDIIFLRHFLNIGTISFMKKKKLINKLANENLTINGIIFVVDFYRIIIIKQLLNLVLKNKIKIEIIKKILNNRYSLIKNKKDRFRYFPQKKWDVDIINCDFFTNNKINKKIFKFTYSLVAKKK